MITESDLNERLVRLCEQFNVPGAAVAVARDDETVVTWTGTANLNTGLPVEEHTLFAAGSVTKVFTATLVMTLVDDGLVDLDAPVTAYVPHFAMPRDPRAGDITVRMLLNHTSGLPGNMTYDFPKGPQVTARFVEHLGECELNSPPGEYWSYTNGGLVLAGRVVEVVTGQPFNDALAERVLRPLALNATSDTDEMILRSTAIGHLVGADGSLSAVPRFQLGTNAPSGSALSCDIHALVGFARMHLQGGRALDGKEVLAPDSVAAMQRATCELPWGVGYSHMGLGWLRRDTPAGPLLAHTGASAGQHSSLTVLPERRGVVAALTNSIAGPAVYSTLLTELLRELFDVLPDTPPSPAGGVEVDLDPMTGTYVADEGRVTFTAESGRLQVSHEVAPGFADTMRLIYGVFPPPPAILTPFAPDGRFLSDNGIPVQFVRRDEDVAPDFVYVGRIYRREN